ncbi:multidrug ABC transporter ATP-binding protein [Ktedonobacter sp. SOSP1-85]|uniref:sugar ABC transporter ATP-binding protein n=1 Tax=Ktedonobacter sp. SOSP1-85 TaxID=2778367 RepID=UPI0019160531|nr:sugar ABC transporter ATP-binding protein [Ktedonobacter sp. SOSP1-85]GHO76849.1 multidrug ABC transporter ATP-binding protein [Ktedonobacter sp. SOSP1-85]
MREAVNGGLGPAQPSVGVAQGVWKAFGETQALRDISLEVRAGECHGLVGRNGAGKSTLVAILTGMTYPDRGVVRIGGEVAPPLVDRAAWQHLVACVYQKSMVVPNLTVAENIFLNRVTSKYRGIVNWRTMRSRARQVMLDWGFDLDINRRAHDLTVEQRQIVEIARALSVGARFLILDEPTASLEKVAIERLFERIRRLKESGVAILFISHHLEEIYEVCDQVTVLRDGVRVLNRQVEEIGQEQLVEAMVGAAPQQETNSAVASQVVASPRPRLEISHLHIPATLGPVQDVSFTVGEGECVGLVGLQGSGTTTVADAVVGLRKPASGEIKLNGKPIQAGRVDATLRQGIAYVPEDRHARGFVPYLGVEENLTLCILDRVAKGGIVSRSSSQTVARRLVKQLGIVASGLDQPVGQLSGGNQQKVVVGRALARQPEVLVVVTPTVGVDVAAKEALLNVIDAARVHGTAVLLISDDLDDLRICTRLLVMVKGRLVKEYQPPWDRHVLITAIEGLEPASAQGYTETNGEELS